jgi:NAD(P)-dependent dehydrogenase (short-subunit alcohol dehydrogenase family)
MASFTGKAAIVTGASSGIGRAIACGLGAADADVVLVGRDRDRLHGTLAEINAAGGSAHAIAADLDDDVAVNDIVQRTQRQFGRVDTVIHCAGLFLTGPVDDSAELLDRQWRTNVRAPFRLTLAALPALRRTRGSVVFLSSIAGHVGFPASSAYCATKGAIEQMTKAIAVEEAPNGVRVNAIAPGNVETPMNAHLMAEPTYKQAMLDATPLGRNGQPQDIVPLALLLAGADGAWITGHSVIIDGGWSAR